MSLMVEQLCEGYFEKHAALVAVFAFRCALQVSTKRDQACAAALKAYLAIHPDDRDASDKVVGAIIEAVKLRPHWLTTKGRHLGL